MIGRVSCRFSPGTSRSDGLRKECFPAGKYERVPPDCPDRDETGLIRKLHDRFLWSLAQTQFLPGLDQTGSSNQRSTSAAVCYVLGRQSQFPLFLFIAVYLSDNKP